MTDDGSDDGLTLEQLADSFVGRFRGGERPSIEAFARRHPEYADELRELLPALVMLEQHAPIDDTAAFGVQGLAPGAPREVGDFTIVREIGRGGMGVVYEAVQQSLGRHVALKVLSSPGLLNPSHLERFRLEARAAARLHHTHIVPVFGVGEHEGMHYYAMQFIPGQSLDLVFDALRQLRNAESPGNGAVPANALSRVAADGLVTGNLFSHTDVRPTDSAQTTVPQNNLAAAGELANSSVIANLTSSELSTSHVGRELYRSVARVGLQVVEALGYAHSQGILHRDIKPSNLLLDAKGNVWITDFGLAKSEDAEGLTQTGDFVGTLRYMAPERLEGWSDRRSDLYGLGATLYELMTLTPFLESATRGKLIERILHDQPTAPSKIDRSIPRDLETVVLKAIAKDPATRYHTAEEMAEDLRRFLADRPILSRRATAAEQLARWCRRNPAVAALLATVALVLTLGIITSSYYAASATREAKAAAKSLADAQVQRERTERVNSFFMEEVFGLADPNLFKRSGITLLDALDAAAGQIDERLADDPELRMVLQDRIGGIYSSLGEYGKAVAQYEKAVPLLQRWAGNDDSQTLRARGQLGFALFKVRRLDEAKQMLRETLAAQTRVFGPADPATLRTDISLGMMQMSAGAADSLDEIEATFRRALESLGPRHPLTYRAQLNYSWALRWAGRYADALPQADAALAGLHETLGDDDVDTIAAMHNHALCLYSLKQMDAAAAELQEIYTRRVRVLGARQIDTVWTLYWLTRALDQSERETQAKQDSEELLKYLESPECDDHFLLQEASHWLAIEAGRGLRDPARAVGLAMRACEITHFTNSNLLETLATAASIAGDKVSSIKWTFAALDLPPVASPKFNRAAVRCLDMEEQEAYRKVCKLMWEKFANDAAIGVRWSVVWTCGLVSGALDDSLAPLELARQVHVAAPANRLYAEAYALWLYRNAEYAESEVNAAETIAAHSKERPGIDRRPYLEFILAMSQWQRGAYDEARESLTAAQRACQSAPSLPETWEQGKMKNVLRHEAEELITPADL